MAKELTEAFTLFDKDGDGKISKTELGEILKKLGQNPTEMDLDDMMHEVDIDKNGSIEFEEFVKLMQKQEGGDHSDQEMRAAFEIFDKNKDGFISPVELEEVMRNLGENLSKEQINQMVKKADIDGDNQINFFEFKKMMQNTA